MNHPNDEAHSGANTAGPKENTLDTSIMPTATKRGNTPGASQAQFNLASDVQRVGAGLSVRFTHRSGQFEAEWTPRTPTRREMKRIVGRYREHRDAFLVELSGRLGGAVAVVEVPL